MGLWYWPVPPPFFFLLSSTLNHSFDVIFILSYSQTLECKVRQTMMRGGCELWRLEHDGWLMSFLLLLITTSNAFINSSNISVRNVIFIYLHRGGFGFGRGLHAFLVYVVILGLWWNSVWCQNEKIVWGKRLLCLACSTNKATVWCWTLLLAIAVIIYPNKPRQERLPDTRVLP